MQRSAGILLPVFSLPSPYGIGSIGKEARAFAAFLKEAGQTWWQILPLGPTGAGDSPYTSLSTFAGNPLLIDLDLLAEDGLLTPEELDSARVPEGAPIDYAALYDSREKLFRQAFLRLDSDRAQAVRSFADAHPWMREYALYRAAKSHFQDAPWYEWSDEALRRHDDAAVELWRGKLTEDVAYHCTVQYWFFTQWQALKTAVNGLGIRLIGDLPIYVSLDSADVWSERKEFLLGADNRPTKVAGVPPDYFSEDGQLWGNPLYDWNQMRANGYGWWIRRVEGASQLVDALRIDHFRAFESYWAVPAGAKTAKEGAWEKGPGMSLLQVLTNWFPHITYLAEDLGILTDDVHRLREESGLAGMKVLEFAFSGADNGYLPHNYSTRHCVCYTGTHDNDTLLGWYDHASDSELAFAQVYLGVTDREAVRQAVLRLGQGSVAELFIAQMQDYLGLGSEGRVNTPGVANGNWRFRMASGVLTPALAQEMHAVTAAFGRC